MKAESLFTSVLLSYKRLLFLTGNTVPIPSLRDYCKSSHVVYRSFLRWASTQDAAFGIVEKERNKQRIRKSSVVKEGTVASMTSCPGNVEDKPLLYPLHIVTDRGEDTTKSVVFPSTATLSSERAQTGESVLRGIRITFPNGVKIWVREADSRGVYCLVHGKES